MKKAIIVGSGIAGMASAIRLRNSGYSVNVFESNSYPGGKLSDFKLNEFRFDAGPQLFTLPDLVDDLFILCGENPSDFFNYKKKEIACNYFWEDGVNLKAYSNQDKFINEVENKLGVSKSVIKKYLDKAKEKYELVENIFLKKSLHKFSTYLTLGTLKALFKISKLEINNSLHDVNLNQLKEKHLVQLYDRYATYNGSDPYKTPGIMSIIQHLESSFGTYVPIKGMNDITQSIYKLAKRQGIKFNFNTKVSEIITDNKIVNGVIAGGKKYESNVVVSNADIKLTYNYLLKDFPIPRHIEKAERSSSAIIFYWGISKKFNQLDLHNILFSQNYKMEFDYIFNKKEVPNDNTIYINITSKDVDGDAPKNSENWFVMINTPSDYGQDWDNLTKKLKLRVIKRINKVLNCKLEDFIVEESVMTPPIIENKTKSFRGALYGQSSNSKFSAFLRHSNFSNKINNLYFCGGSVHPGGGIPLCLMSAKIVEDLVNSKS
jgi:phytoene desaturase